MTSAIVFANHDVGVHCLAVLLAAGVDVRLVVAHDEDPRESLAFASVIGAAVAQGIEVALPDDPNAETFARRIERLAPDFIFSFYYRRLLGERILRAAKVAALNMHGSLLPAYRGRAPTNWAVIRGESITGATLHHMIAAPDAGDIVDQQPVPILPDDTAFDVFGKVTVAAVLVLWRSLPGLLNGTAPRAAQMPEAASYFGRRRPEDGRIDWRADAKTVHNLVRGVAPPYPGAFTDIRGRRLRVLKTALERSRAARSASASIYVEGDVCFVDCAGGGVLRLVNIELDGQPLSPGALGGVLGLVGALALEP
ncbi:MAG TPA: formyltransferase [Burkholderiales bacterium]|nr:formyltransferase [Burkholderiales bacterium]